MRQSGETFMRSLSVAGAWPTTQYGGVYLRLHTGGRWDRDHFQRSLTVVGEYLSASPGQPRATRQPLSRLFISSPPHHLVKVELNVCHHLVKVELTW